VPSDQLRVPVLTALAGTLVLALAALGAAGSGARPTHDVRAVAAAAPVAVQSAPHPRASSTTPAAPPPGGAKCVGLVALTFDDGPQPGVTERLVHELLALHVPATFFMVGHRVAEAPETARRVADAGFAIGNHTWDHVAMTRQSPAQARAALDRTTAVFARVGLRRTRLMRPPYGDLDAAVRTTIAASGLTPVLWTIDSLDWRSGDAGTIAARILRALRPGPDNLVLQHDGVARSPISVRAVPIVVEKARRWGYCFVGIDKHGRPSWPRGYRPGAATRP